MTVQVTTGQVSRRAVKVFEHTLFGLLLYIKDYKGFVRGRIMKLRKDL